MKAVIDGISTYYRIINPQKDQTIILLHSFPTDGTVFDNHIRYLNSKFRIVVPDLPGFARSSSPEEYTIERYSSWLNGFFDYLDIDFSETILYSVSFSGILTLSFDKCHLFNNVIVESVPISPKHIHTYEFLFLDLLQKLPNNMVNRLMRNTTFCSLVSEIYLKIKPKSTQNGLKEEFPSKEAIKQMIKNMNLEGIFQVGSKLRDFKFYEKVKENINTGNVVYVYDKSDPTVSSWHEIKNIVESDRVILTEYRLHAPSFNFPQILLKKLNLV